MFKVFSVIVNVNECDNFFFNTVRQENVIATGIWWNNRSTYILQTQNIKDDFSPSKQLYL